MPEDKAGRVSKRMDTERSSRDATAQPTKVEFEESKRQLNKLMEKRCEKLMDSLGWGNGFRIPFASEENRKLEKDLEFQQRRSLALKTKLKDNVEHCKSLEQHMERVKEDVFVYQALLNNKKSLLEEEKSFLSISERFYSNLSQEKAQYDKTIGGCKQRSQIMQKDLDRRLKGILELRDLIEFDSEALKQYQKRIKNFEEFETDVTKLSLEDARKIRELEESRAELGAFRKELRLKLDHEGMNTAKFHEQFDRLSIEFRKVHRQRREMVQMWAATVQAMKEKDLFMREIAEEYYETKQMLNQVAEALEEKERHFHMMEMGGRQNEMSLSELDRRFSELRRRLDEGRELYKSLKDACSLCQLEVDYTGNIAREKLNGLSKLNQELQELEKKHGRVYTIVCDLKNKLFEVGSSGESSDSKIANLENMLSDEEKAAEALLREMEIIRKFYWDRNNEKRKAEEEIKSTEMAIIRVQNNLANMQTKVITSADFVSKRSNLIYKMDLECSMLENRINKMTNQSIDPRYFELQNTVIELKDSYEKVLKERRFISNELEHVTEMTAKVNSEIGKYRREVIVLESEMRQCHSLSQGLEKIVDLTIKELNEEQVKCSLERVYLKRLVRELKSERQQIFGLSEIRNTIQWAVKERKAEIENHQLLNSSRHKALSMAVSKLRVQFSEVNYRTEKLRGRFDLITKLMSGTHDVNPEMQTLGYQVRKAARERESLQIELAKWKNRLAEAEKEMEGMSNVHSIMNASNNSLKDSLSPAGEDSKELKTLQTLNTEEQEILLRRNRAKNCRVALKDKIEELEQKIAIVDHEVKAIHQLGERKETMTSKMMNELQQQREKVSRWHGICSKMVKEVRSLIPPEYFNFVQMDLKLRFTRSKLESALRMLERLLQQHPYIKKMCTSYICQNRANREMSKLYRRIRSITCRDGSSDSSESWSESLSSSITSSSSSRGVASISSKSSISPHEEEDEEEEEMFDGHVHVRNTLRSNSGSGSSGSLSGEGSLTKMKKKMTLQDRKSFLPHENNRHSVKVPRHSRQSLHPL